MRKKECDVHFKREGVFVLGWARDPETSIYRYFRGPLIKLEPAPTPRILGQAVHRALDVSGRAQGNRGDNFDAALRAAGINGWSRLMRSSRTFSVTDDGSR